jgi:hypothetical protein
VTSSSNTLSTPTRTPLFLLNCLLIGLIIGGLTLLFQDVLPDNFIQIANSGAVWSVVAFVIGRRTASRTRAMLGGFLALVGEVIGYYTFAYFANLMDIMPSTLAVVGYWLIVALVAGPVFGWAGYASIQREGLPGRIGTGAMAAAFIGEGLYLLTILPTPTTGVTWLITAVIITLVLTWNRSDRLQVWGITLVLGLLFFGAEQVLLLLDQLRVQLFQG